MSGLSKLDSTTNVRKIKTFHNISITYLWVNIADVFVLQLGFWFLRRKKRISILKFVVYLGYHTSGANQTLTLYLYLWPCIMCLLWRFFMHYINCIQIQFHYRKHMNTDCYYHSRALELNAQTKRSLRICCCSAHHLQVINYSDAMSLQHSVHVQKLIKISMLSPSCGQRINKVKSHRKLQTILLVIMINNDFHLLYSIINCEVKYGEFVFAFQTSVTYCDV